MWLEALLGLGRDDEAARVLAEAEKADVVSSYAYDMIANRELRANHTATALELFLKARNPKLPIGLWGHLSGSQWQQWTRIADCYWSLGHYKRALAELEQAITLVPEDQRRSLSLTVFDRCVEEHQDTAAYRWAAHAHEHSGDDLDQHFEVVDRVFALPAQASRKGVYAALDGAVARQNWQKVYDEATRLPLDHVAGVARVLRISQRFVDEGAADAALDLLNRAIDAFPREPRVYWSLVRALNALGRHADAADALAVLESLNSEAPALKAA
jgi:tetratricopeptide (TPR) repeat protein